MRCGELGGGGELRRLGLRGGGCDFPVGDRGEGERDARGESGATTGERGDVGDRGERGEPGMPFAKESALSSSTGVENSSPMLEEDLLRVGIICVLVGRPAGSGGTGGTGSSCIVCATGVLSLASDFSGSEGESFDLGAALRSVLRRGSGGGTVTRRPSPGGLLAGLSGALGSGAGVGKSFSSLEVEREGEAG